MKNDFMRKQNLFSKMRTGMWMKRCIQILEIAGKVVFAYGN